MEALDARHLAGWYHPAMRLQEHLNVVQGSNAELRSQLKLLRYFNKVSLKDQLYRSYFHESEEIVLHVLQKRTAKEG